ncbi:MAG TPA: ABC transporter permease, partial [Paenirhodobacter sp.]
MAAARTTVLAVLAALAAGGLLFLPFGANPFSAYTALFSEGFLSLRGFGFTLVRTAPLLLVALGVIVAWRTGFGYLGFEGCVLIGAAAATWVALLAVPDGPLAALPFVLFLPLVVAIAFAAGGVWAGITALFKARFGGNEVITSLMMNYVAALVVQYLVSGPMREPGGLPQSPRLPPQTWLPVIIDGTRAHAGILIAVIAAGLVWLVLLRARIGYEMIVTGLNPCAAAFGGIDIGSRQILAAFLAGGLAALAGLVEVLGLQHRLIDGMSGGVGFTGMIAALLGAMHPFGAAAAAFLYVGMTVGADAMQRQAGLPGSIIFMVQSLIVLFILGGVFFRDYRLCLPRRRPKEA